VSKRDVGAPETLVLLHGFGGTRRMWDDVAAHLERERYRPLALDLPGHGAVASSRGPITFARCVEAVLAASPERFALCGYSMGGRIALHVALAAPERISRLVLVAASPGIDDPQEREQRRLADRRLADELELEPFADFLDRWNTQPLFAEDPPEVAERARADQRRNDPRALAVVMRSLGTGEMAPLWSRLGELRMPVTILVGERDAKFRALAQRIDGTLAHGADVRLLQGGHRLPLESPRAVARELDRSMRGRLAARASP
jgi:2-succinyl-6-hydroxy-2,4-cyclohexadiene-1-carboxylate synthase